MNSPNDRNEDAADQGQKAYFDIVRSTATDINNILQSKKIFLIINIIILLTIVFMGRILINFIEPLPVPQAPTEFIEKEKLQRSTSFNPYQLSKYNKGIFLFGNLHSNPGNRVEKSSYTMYMGTVIDKNDLDNLTSYVVKTPIGEFTLPAKSTIVNLSSSGMSAEDNSGCYKDRCYVRVYVHADDNIFTRGVYSIKGVSGSNTTFESYEVISNTDIAKAMASRPINYDVSQINPGEMRVSLLSSPTTEIVRVEVHAITGSGKKTMEPYMFWRTEFPVTVPFKTSSKSLKIYATEMTDVYNDKPTRRFKIIGNYPKSE